MAVLAHPDDESLGFGPTLARYAAEGVETYVVTATLGQAGRYGALHAGEPGHPGPAALGAMRERELRAAIDVLGVRELTLLGYMDGTLDEADPARLAADVAKRIREVRPQVVMTFAADGGYGHPDHIAISQATAAAVVAACDRNAPVDGGPPHAVGKFYWLAWTESQFLAYEAALKALTSTVDGVVRQATAWPDWEITTVLDARAYLAPALHAMHCHVSQVEIFGRLRQLPMSDQEAVWGRPCFYRVMSRVNGGRRRESDLFEGVREALAVKL
jgi:LmbE family N-acetylglucosaminyl deacetylase